MRCRYPGCHDRASWKLRVRVWHDGRTNRTVCRDHHEALREAEELGIRVVSALRLRELPGHYGEVQVT